VCEAINFAPESYLVGPHSFSCATHTTLSSNDQFAPPRVFFLPWNLVQSGNSAFPPNPSNSAYREPRKGRAESPAPVSRQVRPKSGQDDRAPRSSCANIAAPLVFFFFQKFDLGQITNAPFVSPQSSQPGPGFENTPIPPCAIISPLPALALARSTSLRRRCRKKRFPSSRRWPA